MASSQLANELYQAYCAIPLIDPHSHINPHSPVSKTVDDILGYHYYTELAHSAGMSQDPLADTFDPKERVKAILNHMGRFSNTAQYSWFVEIAETFLRVDAAAVASADGDAIYDASVKQFSAADWEQQVFQATNLEKIFLTNEFDDPLEGFDTSRYVPCLRTDSLVFQLYQQSVKERLAKATGVEVGDQATLRAAVRKLFEHFHSKGAKACAISLPPNFAPRPLGSGIEPEDVFWILAEHCREFSLPFDLMIGVNRAVYKTGVFQGQDLFDRRTSLIQYQELFNAFLDVTFPISVLTSGQNQELVAYSWIFPNVIPNGHWWYSNIPCYIRSDLTERLQAVPKTKLVGYYSDAYKLEFVLPKFNMYRRILANVVASEFVETGLLNVNKAVELGKLLLRDNVISIFKV